MRFLIYLLFFPAERRENITSPRFAPITIPITTPKSIIYPPDKLFTLLNNFIRFREKKLLRKTVMRDIISRITTSNYLQFSPFGGTEENGRTEVAAILKTTV